MMMNGSGYRNNNSGVGAMPVSRAHQIMARFRPIAPKPAAMAPSAPPACSSSSSTSAKPFSIISSTSSNSSKQHGRGRKRSPAQAAASDGGAQKSPASPRKKIRSCILRPIVPVTKVPPAAAAALNRSFTTPSSYGSVENSAFLCSDVFPGSLASSDSSCFVNRAAISGTAEPDMAVSSSKGPNASSDGSAAASAPSSDGAKMMELKTLPLLPEAPLRPPSPCDSSVTSCNSSQASGDSPERDPPQSLTALCLRPGHSDDQAARKPNVLPGDLPGVPQDAQKGHSSRLGLEDGGLDLALLEQAYTSCPEPVALTDELHRMLWCNPAFTSTVSQGRFDELGTPVPIFSFVLKSACRVVLWAFWKRLVFQDGGFLPTFVGPLPKKPDSAHAGKKPIAPQPVRAVRSTMYEQWSFDILERQRRQLC